MVQQRANKLAIEISLNPSKRKGKVTSSTLCTTPDLERVCKGLPPWQRRTNRIPSAPIFRPPVHRARCSREKRRMFQDERLRKLIRRSCLLTIILFFGNTVPTEQTRPFYADASFRVTQSGAKSSRIKSIRETSNQHCPDDVVFAIGSLTVSATSNSDSHA